MHVVQSFRAARAHTLVSTCSLFLNWQNWLSIPLFAHQQAPNTELNCVSSRYRGRRRGSPYKRVFQHDDRDRPPRQYNAGFRPQGVSGLHPAEASPNASPANLGAAPAAIDSAVGNVVATPEAAPAQEDDNAGDGGAMPRGGTPARAAPPPDALPVPGTTPLAGPDTPGGILDESTAPQEAAAQDQELELVVDDSPGTPAQEAGSKGESDENAKPGGISDNSAELPVGASAKAVAGGDSGALGSPPAGGGAAGAAGADGVASGGASGNLPGAASKAQSLNWADSITPAGSEA